MLFTSMSETLKHQTISPLAVVQPMGDAGDRGRAQACFLFDNRVRHFLREHFGGPEPFGELIYLVGRKQIAQKTPRLVGGP